MERLADIVRLACAGACAWRVCGEAAARAAYLLGTAEASPGGGTATVSKSAMPAPA